VLGLANAYPNPEPLNGTIPRNTNATIDPSLIRRQSDGKLFLYGTGPGPTGNIGGYVWTADSLYGPWTQSNDSALSEECDAPNIFEADGIYYMFYAKPFDWAALGYTNPNASIDSHNKALYVRNSTTLEPLSWNDDVNATRLLIDWSQNYNQLDISVILSEEGQYLASFGSYQQGIYQIPLEPTLDAVINGSGTTQFNMNGNNIHHLAENFTWITDPVPNTDLIEASFQFYWDGYYYLFFSSGHAQTQAVGSTSIWSNAGDVYKIMVCRSVTATGSFVDSAGQSCLESGGTEILATHDLIWAPGGQGVLNDTEVGGPIIYYHYVPRTSTDGAPIGGGYSFGWNKLDFSGGWPVL
ncbi:glycosyl hydrolase, partial [Coniella lustricola]